MAGLAACRTGVPPEQQTRDSTAGGVVAAFPDDSARAAFLDGVDSLLLDTQIHELRGHLGIKVRNTNPNDPESPLSDRDVPHPDGIGPHTYLGVMHAEVGALRAALGDTAGRREGPPMHVAIEEDRVYVGRPPREVVIVGHRHGDQLFVPVKLFARPYGAYVRIACPLANCASIWPRDILRYMREAGYTSSAGVLEGYAEGLIDRVDVRKLPTG
ncbi:MAG TPA: hypothetical protein VFZ21_31570 [Gemmatimonadaceae bacterium]|nr:hypothetical protein [Gemmatimonadaceae bacterium]